MSPKKIVVVLGMHRSGTSALTRGLQVLGATFGDNLMPPVPGNNEKGFWEDLDIYSLNESLLKKAGSTWHHMGPLKIAEFTSDAYAEERRDASQLLTGKLADTDVFAFKDPRTAILLPFWQAVFDDIGADARYVIALRNPLEIAASIQRRDGIELTKGLMLWAKHILSAVRYTNGKPRIFVSFENLLDNPTHELSRIAQAFDLSHPDVSSANLENYTNGFLERGLRHEISPCDDSELLILGHVLASRLNRLLADQAVLKPGAADQLNAEQWKAIESSFDDCAALLHYVDVVEEQRFEAVKLNDHLEKDNEALTRDSETLTKNNEALTRDIDAGKSTITELEFAHGRTTRELKIVQKTLLQSEENLLVAYNQIDAVVQSASWRITAPLRGTKTFLKNPVMGARAVLSVCVQRISHRIPLHPRAKSALVDAVFSVFPFVFGWSATYKAWHQAKDIKKKKELGLAA